MRRRKFMIILPVQIIVPYDLRDRSERKNYNDSESTDFDDEFNDGSNQSPPRTAETIKSVETIKIVKTKEQDDVSVGSSNSPTPVSRLYEEHCYSNVSHTQVRNIVDVNNARSKNRESPENIPSCSHHNSILQTGLPSSSSSNTISQHENIETRDDSMQPLANSSPQLTIDVPTCSYHEDTRANFNSELQSTTISSSSSSTSSPNENTKTRKRKKMRYEIEKMKEEWNIEKQRKEFDHEQWMAKSRENHEQEMARMDREHEQKMARMAKKHEQEMQKKEKKRKE
ncbi:probable serine/threonine-protein kinase DDB_G0280133 [Sitodiplosis mosellana]|uniref:probable serine/threonine-protein kinase DDB_G0280133 n=1 Tax=Sitodiplosis mosellana TaxID=263140 RepID=UPI002443EAF2|nr:probable serine/threonine-protein kinase DDB_G0280133 [Sitodiplosis mosellana]